MTREELRERIKAKRKEKETAGEIHRRDLEREIRRMEKELMTYCHYQEAYKKRQGISA